MALSPQDFQFVSELVRRESAIVLAPGKEYLVEARLLPLARKAGLTTVTDFVHRVRARPDQATQRSIVDALTTNETSWYRDGEPFTVLAETVVPELLAARAATRRLRLWSAACSSGQEPYTLAMVLADTLPPGWSYEIQATDISNEMLARAEAGKFSQLEVNRGLPAGMLVRHMQRVGTSWQVSPELRRHVTFRWQNLAAPMPVTQPYDVIFLRNVLIYFDMETKRSILRRIRALLKPDGWLFLGSAETTIGVDDGFERVATRRTSAYRPKSGAAQTKPQGFAPVGATGKR